MSFTEEWHQGIVASLADALRLAQDGESIDFTYGLLATAVLWPVRQQVRDFDPEAIAAIQAICSDGSSVLSAMQAWPEDRLAAGRSLSAAAEEDDSLKAALHELLAHFDATHLLQQQLALQYEQLPETVIETIRAAIVNVGGVLNIDQLSLTMAAMPEIPAPAAPDRPPGVSHFVGRERELAYYREKLSEHHIAVIVGMAGVGKSALAAQLAQRLAEPEKIFWHTFRQGESIQVLVWELANFLAWDGQDELWNLLQRAQQSGGQPPAAETLFNYVLQMVPGQGYLFCLDDFQHVDEDPIQNLLLRQLRELLAVGQLDIVITSRRMPDLLQVAEFDPLDGMEVGDAGSLLRRHGVTLEDDELAGLVARTGGNAALLTLAAETLATTADPGGLLEKLAHTANVERFLLKQVDAALSEEEQTVMAAVSVLLGYPGTRDAVEAVIDGDNVWRVLRALAERQLLVVQEGEGARTYSQHAIIQAFYYNTLGRRKRRRMHRRAAHFYDREAPNPLRAGLHYLRGGDQPAAAGVLTGDLWRFVNQGQAGTLRQLLGEFDGDHLDEVEWAQVNLMAGRLETVLGDAEAARPRLERVQQMIAGMPEKTAQAMRPALALAQADMLDQEAPAGALGWLERGLEVPDLPEAEAAALYIKRGNILMDQGEFGAAVEALRNGLATLPAGREELRCEALTNLGAFYGTRGDLESAEQVTTEALALSRRIHHHFRTVELLSNLGNIHFMTGRWAQATAFWEEALVLARRLGSKEQALYVEGNIAVACIFSGRLTEARAHLDNSLALAQKLNLQFALLNVYCNRAELALRENGLDEAEAALDEAQALGESLKSADKLAEIQALRAKLALARGEFVQAQALCARALADVRELQMAREQGRVLRTLARAEAAKGDGQAALEHFAASHETLAAIDPYEAARTQAAWARQLAPLDPARAGALQDKARQTFLRLGAEWDLARLEEVVNVRQQE